MLQVTEIAERGGHDETRSNSRVINMLRGGVLYVKVKKPQQALPGTSDLPSKASQVSHQSEIASLLWVISGAGMLSMC